MIVIFLELIIYVLTDSGNRTVECVGLQQFDYWDRWFKYH